MCVRPDGLTIFELLAHDGACGGGDVVGGVLLGVGRCDDRHQMVSVRRVDLNRGGWDRDS